MQRDTIGSRDNPSRFGQQTNAQRLIRLLTITQAYTIDAHCCREQQKTRCDEEVDLVLIERISLYDG
jgi:hypothetical protein